MKLSRLAQHQSQRENANESKFIKLKEEYEEVVNQHRTNVLKAQENDNLCIEYTEKVFICILIQLEILKKDVEQETSSLNINYNNLFTGIEYFKNSIQKAKC